MDLVLVVWQKEKEEEKEDGQQRERELLLLLYCMAKDEGIERERRKWLYSLE